jgi:hypothetical protein
MKFGSILKLKSIVFIIKFQKMNKHLIEIRKTLKICIMCVSGVCLVFLCSLYFNVTI